MSSTNSNGSILQKQPIFPYIRVTAVTFALTLLLFSIRWALPESIHQYFWGADGWFMADLIESNPFPLYYRSLLTILIHKSVYLLLHPFGISGWNAISVSSSLAGAIALQALWRMNPDPWFIAINALCGSFLVFVGHVENYAWVNVFLILSFWFAHRWLAGETKAWPAFLFLMLACLSHMLAIFYAPAYVYLLYKNRRFDPREILIPVVVFSVLISVLTLCFEILGTDVGFERLVPWGHVWSKNQFFTFMSAPHREMLFYFHRRAAFLGIPIELPLLLLFLFLKKIDTLYLRFLFLCTLCGLFWTTIWHPDWGRLDWDLFSQFGIPLHVLLGFLIRPVWKRSPENTS